MEGRLSSFSTLHSALCTLHFFSLVVPDGQREDEARAAARGVFDADVTAVGLDDAARDCQPHPRAGRPEARGGDAGCVRAEELVEDALAQARGHARPFVLDRDLDHVALAPAGPAAGGA